MSFKHDINQLPSGMFQVYGVNFLFNKKPPEWIVPQLQAMWRLAYDLGYTQHKNQTKEFFTELLDLEVSRDYDE